MNIRLVCSALIIGALTAVTVPQNLSVAQSSDQGSVCAKECYTEYEYDPAQASLLAS